MLKDLLGSLFVSQSLVFFVARRSPADLTLLGELMEARKVAPVIDKCYRLSEAREAFRHLETGHARGKVVIAVEPAQEPA